MIRARSKRHVCLFLEFRDLKCQPPTNPVQVVDLAEAAAGAGAAEVSGYFISTSMTLVSVRLGFEPPCPFGDFCIDLAKKVRHNFQGDETPQRTLLIILVFDGALLIGLLPMSNNFSYFNS